MALDRRSALLGRVLAVRRLGVNVLAAGDDDIALRFARAAPLVYGHRTFGTHSRFDRRPRRPIDDAIAACAPLTASPRPATRSAQT